MKASYCKKSLLETIDFMKSDLSHFVKRPGIDFSRNRACPFQSLLLCLLAMEGRSLSRELRRFFALTDKGHAATKSAFVQQRAKLNGNAFPFLFSAMNGKFPFKKTFRGLHLLACDGSDVNIPPLSGDASTCVASNTAGIYYHQVHLNTVYDILEERFSDLLVQPRARMDEREAFTVFLQRNPLPGKSLFIADRGYFSLNVIGHLVRSPAFFLLRMRSDGPRSSFLNRFRLPDVAEFDMDLDFAITRSRRKAYLSHPDRFVYVRPDRPFDFIPPDDRESLFPVSVRLVRLTLPDGGSVYLLTDLPRHSFGPETLKYLYRLRWGIETSFRYLKYGLSLTAFHSVRRDFILQEIFARVILFNLTMLIVHCVALPRRERQYEYKLSVSDAFAICRDFLIQRIKNETIEKDLLKHVTDIRPGRSFPRKTRSKRFIPLNYRG